MKYYYHRQNNCFYTEEIIKHKAHVRLVMSNNQKVDDSVLYMDGYLGKEITKEKFENYLLRCL